MPTINEVLNAKNITALVHFTRYENLDSIMRYGIQPRSVIDNHAIPITGITNDAIRLDGKTEANCLSVSFPNSAMFYRLRIDNPNTHWVVIAVKPEILLTNDCSFYPTNAACNQVRFQDIRNFRGAEAFQRMFDLTTTGTVITNRVDHSYLLESDPTDVQAEILSYGVIPPTHIIGCIFQQKKHQDIFNQTFSGYKSTTALEWGPFDNRRKSRINGYTGISVSRG